MLALDQHIWAHAQALIPKLALLVLNMTVTFHVRLSSGIKTGINIILYKNLYTNLLHLTQIPIHVHEYQKNLICICIYHIEWHK